MNRYTYTGNNPLRYIDPSGHCFTETSQTFCKQAADYIEKDANAAWETLKKKHESFDSAADYWSMGSYSELQEVMRIGKEKPMSYEHWVASGQLFIGLVPAGKAGKATGKTSGVLINAIKGCNCFTAGTKVLTDEGEKPIEAIEVGDKVLAKSDTTGEVEYKEVVKLFQKQADEIYYIRIGDEVIETTGLHPFWLDGKGWTLVRDLKIGDLLVTSDGTKLAIEKIEIAPRQTTVYNFMVADYHSYFVSNLGIWVHNCTIITAGKNFKDHFIRHKGILENSLGIKYPKYKTHGDAFLSDIGKIIDNGTVSFVGKGTLKKDGEILNIYRGNGMTVATKANGEFVTLLESGKGMDIGIKFIP
ncbi:polymorphic toxin-type HINT domain-containing protein [Brevibacillus porteri]|uniref:polymorphic toxin-type HINT domain-containing protein n=1 Tax=Brevibacillus porteri TaxID=2126350 RepID=UPI003D23B0F3